MFVLLFENRFVLFFNIAFALLFTPCGISLASPGNVGSESLAAKSRDRWGEPENERRGHADSGLSPSEKRTARDHETGLNGRKAKFESFASERIGLREVVNRCLRRNFQVRGLSERLNSNRGKILEEKSWFDTRVRAEAKRGSEMQPLLSTSMPSRSRITESSVSLGLERNLETGGRIAADFLLKHESTEDRNMVGAVASPPTMNQRYSVGPKLEFQQPLLRGLGVRVSRAKIVMAKNSLARSRQELRSEMLELVAAAAQSYWELLFMSRILDIHKKSLDIAKEQLLRSNKMVEIGHLAPAEVKAVERALASREIAVIESRNDIVAASVALRGLMGERISSLEVIAIQPNELPPVRPMATFDAKEVASEAIEGNPRVLGLVEQLKSERTNYIVSKNRTRPKLDLFVSLALRGISRDRRQVIPTGPEFYEEPGRVAGPSASGGFRDAFQSLWSPSRVSATGGADYLARAGLVFSWAPRGRLRQGQILTARSRIRAATLEVDRARQELANRLVSIYWARRASYSKLLVSQRAVDFAKDNLRAEQARFNTGRSTNYDVLLRIEELTQERTKELRAHVDVLQLDLQMGAITGVLLEQFGLA